MKYKVKIICYLFLVSTQILINYLKTINMLTMVFEVVHEESDSYKIPWQRYSLAGIGFLTMVGMKPYTDVWRNNMDARRASAFPRFNTCFHWCVQLDPGPSAIL